MSRLLSTGAARLEMRERLPADQAQPPRLHADARCRERGRRRVQLRLAGRRAARVVRLEHERPPVAQHAHVQVLAACRVAGYRFPPQRRG